MPSTSLLTRPGIALDHAIGLGRSGPGVPILCTKDRAGFGEGWREATDLVGQHVSEAEREGCRSLAQKGDGALLGFVVLG